MNKRERDVTAVIAIAVLVVVMMIFALAPATYIRTDAKLSAYGEFDRVELVDRHYGNYNGMEVEGKLLAVLYDHGTVSIEGRHYEGGFTQTDENFCFFLYVYADEDHLRERISVVGGDVEEYEYLNVTVTVSLATKEVTVVRNPVGVMLLAVAFAIVLFVLYWAVLRDW